MQLQLIMLAENAQHSEGCFTIQRGGWDTTTVDADGPRLRASLVIKLLLDDDELGIPHRLQLECGAEDSNDVVLTAETNVEGVRPDGYPLHWPVPLDVLIRLDGPLPDVGCYVVALSVEGKRLGQLFFRATTADAPAVAQ